jgi:hypothetical protein
VIARRDIERRLAALDRMTEERRNVTEGPEELRTSNLGTRITLEMNAWLAVEQDNLRHVVAIRLRRAAQEVRDQLEQADRLEGAIARAQSPSP